MQFRTAGIRIITPVRDLLQTPETPEGERFSGRKMSDLHHTALLKAALQLSKRLWSTEHFHRDCYMRVIYNPF